MNKVLRCLSMLFVSLFISFSAHSQNSEWENYTSGREVTALVEEGNYIWVGTSGGGLIKIDKD
jgi:hypothetical protein